MRTEVEKYLDKSKVYPINKSGIKEAFEDGFDAGITESLGLGEFRKEAWEVIQECKTQAFKMGIAEARREVPGSDDKKALLFMTFFNFMVKNRVTPDQAARSAASAISNIGFNNGDQ